MCRFAGAGWMVVGVMIVMLSGSAVYAQQPAAQPAQQAQAQKSPYVFASDAAAILNFVKADKTADYEMVIGKLKEALAKSEKPERKQQAASWKLRPWPPHSGATSAFGRAGSRIAPVIRFRMRSFPRSYCTRTAFTGSSSSPTVRTNGARPTSS